MFPLYLNLLIIVIDWKENLSFLEEVQSAAALTNKQVKRSYLPIVSLVPIVSELQKSTRDHFHLVKVIA